MAEESPASITPSAMPDWRGEAERSIMYHRSFRPVRGKEPGDDDMYRMLIGDAPVQHYTVGLSPEPPMSDYTYFANYVTSSTLVWCFLIVLTGIISFTTTLFILTLIDSEYGDSTPAPRGQQDSFLEEFPPAPPRPIITPSSRNDTHYEDIS
ncbi:hypothetical protein MTO96_035851 [Rhipicephalus appendiculatus]